MFQMDVMKQMVSMNRLAFDSMYTTLSMVQDQAEQMTDFYLHQNAKLPESNKKLYSDWVAAVKTGRDEYKKVVDRIFDTFSVK